MWQQWSDHAFETIQSVLFWAPNWVPGLVIMAVLVTAVLVLHRTFRRAVLRWVGTDRKFLRNLISAARGPTEAALILVAVAASLPAAYLPAALADIVLHAVAIGGIGVLGWAGVIAIDQAAELYMRRFRTDVDDNLKARKHITQIRILLRAAEMLLVLVTLAASLMTVDAVRQYGVSLFASAGAAGLILGLAARPVLSNMIAGLQIAITQPIRVEDAVVVEGEWGWIEDITSTYVVIRLWDWRRLIVPLTYFMEKPFQNWTYQTSAVIGTVLLRVDYTVPVPAVRAELERIVAESKLWNGAVVNLQVTDAGEHSLELRALASASTGPRAWDLRCEVREKLIAFLQKDYPGSLPRQRLDIPDTARPRTDMVGAF
jgi:small-conductance mechanosensitive channel